MAFDLHYISEGVGRPLVFQHGLTADVQQIRKLLGGLSDIHLVSMDCPGHGQSECPIEYQITFRSYTDDLIRLMDQLNIKKAVVGGLSMGSGIAVNMALRYPDRVAALILLRPAWLDQPDPDNLNIINQATSFMNKKGGQEEFEKLASFRNIQIANPGAANSILGVFSEHQQSRLYDVIKSMINDCPFGEIGLLGNLDIPSLILGNDDDPIHPFVMSERIHERISGSILKKLTSRYIDPESHKRQVREAVIDFINKLEMSV